MAPLLSRIRIAAKLWLGYSVVAVILAGLALVQIGLLHEDESRMLGLVETRMVPVRQLKRVSDAYNIRILFAARQVRGGTLEPAEGLARVRTARREAEGQWAAFKAAAGPGDAETAARVDALAAFVTQDLDRLEELLLEGRLPTLGRFLDDDLLPQLLPFSTLLGGLAQQQEEAAQAAVRQMQARSQWTRRLSYAVILGGLAAALALGYRISRDLSGGLARMAAKVRRAAEGDLEVRVRIEGRDELADLGRDLNRMISRLRETIAALAAQEAAERAVLQHAQVAIVVRDTEGVIRRLNPCAEALLGYPAEEMVGGTASPWLDPEEVARHARTLSARLGRPVEGGTEVLRLLVAEGPDLREWIFVTRDGRRLPMLVALSAITGEDGTPMGFVSLGTDLSGIKALEADLRASEARAQAANRAKSAFLSNMSHELRTPLNAILGYAQLMNRKGGRSAEDRDQLDRILGAGEHLLALINEVLSLSRIESGELALRVAPFRSGPLLEGVVGMQRLRAEAKGLTLRLEVGEDFPADLEGDEAKLRQVLVNLVGNAVKFTARGEVVLRASYSEGRAAFEVADTGPGISEEDQRQLFQPFYQAANHPQAAEGTGLGLHISRSLVRFMGGELGLWSRLGEGSRFHFSLPLPVGEPPLELEDRGRVLALEEGQRQALMMVVDDRPENRDLLVRLLTSVGFQVLAAADGVEAVELWDRHRPELVWMDLRMPRMSGFEALQVIRGRELEQGLPPTFVVAISASVIDLDREALRQAGFDDFLGKPFRESQLFELSSRFLGLRFRTREAEAEPPAPADLAGALAQQPAAWRADLREAVLIGDVEAALGLADQATPQVAEALRNRLRAYHLQELLDALNG